MGDSDGGYGNGMGIHVLDFPAVSATTGSARGIFTPSPPEETWIPAPSLPEQSCPPPEKNCTGSQGRRRRPASVKVISSCPWLGPSSPHVLTRDELLLVPFSNSIWYGRSEEVAGSGHGTEGAAWSPEQRRPTDQPPAGPKDPLPSVDLLRTGGDEERKARNDLCLRTRRNAYYS